MMDKGKGKSGSGQPSTEEAAEWYALNEVDKDFNAETLMKWDGWASDVRNRQEYAAIADLRQETRRTLPAPSNVSRGELLGDLESDLEK
jgi:ferric-dicitrate binding protein FerR (iron transport regulator)